MPIKLLYIPTDAEGKFIDRPNRFLSIVDIIQPAKSKAASVKVHVHDPGRLNELLFSGNYLMLKAASSKTRKTGWDAIAAMHDGKWILIHSGFHREITERLLNNSRTNPFGRLKSVQAEKKFGNSRLDFLLINEKDEEIWVEVKGCTLAVSGTALFPDAPTTRGTKHLESLIKICKQGKRAAVIILVFRDDAECFAPNKGTDPLFSKTFRKAEKAGVEVHPVLLKYENEYVSFIKEIPLCKY
jgi:sugar fermentation stimulation protein A